MSRNDNRTPATDVFGKPNKTYSGDIPSFPVIVEKRTANQETPIKAIGTPHDRIPGAILVAQFSSPGDNTDGNITEHYETLPGPYLPFTRYDVFLGPIQGTHRFVRNTGQAASLSTTTRTTYQARDESAVVSIETVEINTNGVDPVFPTQFEHDYDDNKVAVYLTKQVVVKTGSEVPNEVLVGGNAVKTTYQEYPDNPLLLIKVIETFAVPGPTRGGLKKSPQAKGTLVQVEDSIQPYNVDSLVANFGLLEYSDYQTDDATLKRHAVYVFSFPTLTEVYYQMELNGRRVVKQYTIVPISDASEFASPGSSIEYRKIDDDAFRKIQIYTVWDSVTPFTERRLAAYNFANLFDATIYFWSDACGAFGNMQADRNYLTFIYTKHETFSSLPTEQVYLMVRPRTHMVGRGWQPFVATINDEFVFSYSGACTESFTFAASDPDLTTYLGLIQSSNPWSPGGVASQIIAEECTLGEDLFYHRITHKIVPQ